MIQIANIKWVASIDEADTEKSYVCPMCHDEVSYSSFDRKSDNPIYDWNCLGCFTSVDTNSLHLMLVDIVED